MITVLAKWFIRDELPDEEKRGAYGILSGVVGIILNLILFAGKMFAGILSHSIAITADAFNNLSDAGSSIVTLIGFKLAGQKPDKDHPFGHGRMEYIAGLVVSGVILMMAVELLKDSIDKIIHPADELEISVVIIGILIASILVKLYMAVYNTGIAKKISSATIKAVAMDSLSDCVATSVVLLAMGIAHVSGLKLDGIGGVFVAGFILKAGIEAAKDTLDPLLGQPPERSFVEEIERTALEFDENIIGVHDLLVHDYGPGRCVISLHAEVPSDGDIMVIHDIIDNLEHAMWEKFGCMTTIHMDPVAVNDEATNQMKEKAKEVVRNIDETISLHDFRMVPGNTHTNIIFDVVIPFGYKMSDEELVKTIQKKIQEELGNHVFAVIQVDKLAVQD